MGVVLLVIWIRRWIGLVLSVVVVPVPALVWLEWTVEGKKERLRWAVLRTKVRILGRTRRQLGFVTSIASIELPTIGSAARYNTSHL